MQIYLVFDNPQYYLSPILCGIDITEFAAKNTDYEIRVMLNVELDIFAKQVYGFLKPNLGFSEWYEKQKRLQRIYADSKIRVGKIPTIKEMTSFLAYSL